VSAHALDEPAGIQQVYYNNIDSAFVLKYNVSEQKRVPITSEPAMISVSNRKVYWPLAHNCAYQTEAQTLDQN